MESIEKEIAEMDLETLEDLLDYLNESEEEN